MTDDFYDKLVLEYILKYAKHVRGVNITYTEKLPFNSINPPMMTRSASGRMMIGGYDDSERFVRASMHRDELQLILDVICEETGILYKQQPFANIGRVRFDHEIVNKDIAFILRMERE